MLLIVCISAMGQMISEEEAKRNAFRFLSSIGNNVKARDGQDIKLNLEHKAGKDGKVSYYVFNKSDGGFVIAAGDEVAEEILCYSATGTFDKSDISPNFQYWLDEYERQISFALEYGVTSSAVKAAASERTDVTPLVKTKWDQLAPYNNMCPKLNSSGTRKAYTGCVATAMSQVMRYHEWPEVAHGSHSYYDIFSEEDRSGDFDGHRYDWKNMLLTYNGTYTEKQANAVAQLMLDCGIAVEMAYSGDGSAAWSENIAYALVNYFGYDAGISQVFHDHCTDEEWAGYIYNELSSNRPVIFSGETVDYAGHCFICDGYDAATGKYHFNWGWGGSDDCYCALTAVKAGYDKFSYYQDIVFGIQPPLAETVVPINIAAMEGNLYYTSKIKDDKTTFTVKYRTMYGTSFVYNATYCDVDVLFTMKYENVETGDCHYAALTDIEANRKSFKGIYPLREGEDGYVSYDGFEDITVSDVMVPDLPYGKYRVTLVYKDYLYKDSTDKSMWQEVRTDVGSRNYREISIDNPDAIDELPGMSVQDVQVYDLAGRKVTVTPASGIYVINGKKILLK